MVLPNEGPPGLVRIDREGNVTIIYLFVVRCTVRRWLEVRDPKINQFLPVSKRQYSIQIRNLS